MAASAQHDGVEVLNLLSLVGSIGVFAGFGLVLLSLAGAFVFSSADPDIDDRNPWGGHTLEWLTASPPEPGNFEGPLVVTSEAPLLDEDFVIPYASHSKASS